MLSITPLFFASVTENFDPSGGSFFSGGSAVFAGTFGLLMHLSQDFLSFRAVRSEIDGEGTELLLHLSDPGRVGDLGQSGNGFIHQRLPAISNLDPPELRDEHVGILLLDAHTV
jgi:hypothetical protein